MGLRARQWSSVPRRGTDLAAFGSKDEGQDEKQEWIHFVGIGGAGLSALAMLALKQVKSTLLLMLSVFVLSPSFLYWLAMLRLKLTILQNVSMLDTGEGWCPEREESESEGYGRGGMEREG